MHKNFFSVLTLISIMLPAGLTAEVILNSTSLPLVVMVFNQQKKLIQQFLLNSQEGKNINLDEFAGNGVYITATTKTAQAVDEADVTRCGCSKPKPQPKGALEITEETDVTKCGCSKPKPQPKGVQENEADVTKCGCSKPKPQPKGAQESIEEIEVTKCGCSKPKPQPKGVQDDADVTDVTKCGCNKPKPQPRPATVSQNDIVKNKEVAQKENLIAEMFIVPTKMNNTNTFMVLKANRQLLIKVLRNGKLVK